jgi:uncharacterized protein (AIM24 family)
MQTQIVGTTMPVLDVRLDPNESVFSESGELSWMTASIQMTTHTQMGGGGGLFGVLKRVAGGGSLFMTEYRAWGRTRLGVELVKNGAAYLFERLAAPFPHWVSRSEPERM